MWDMSKPQVGKTSTNNINKNSALKNAKKSPKKNVKKKIKVTFLKSGFLQQDYPTHNKKEVAFVGRSNAGKSSLINALAGEKIAHVSQTPGKTRLLNFFAFGDSYVLVDMPGYGFASRSGDEITEWQKAIETYLDNRECLGGLVLVMDVRRDWEEHEKMLLRFANKIGVPMVVAMTKIDRLNQKELKERLNEIKKHAHTSLLFPISSTTHVGYREMEEYIYKEWIKA